MGISSANAMGMLSTLGIQYIPGTRIVFNPSDIVGMFNASNSLTIVTAFVAIANSWNLLLFTRIAFAFIGARNGRMSQVVQLNAACNAKRPS